MKILVIMAGGESKRMGRDKVFLKLNGETFLEYLYNNAKSRFDRIVISTDTKDHADKIRWLTTFKDIPDEDIIVDAYERCGPIGGICSVFDKTDIEKFAVVPTDVPKANIEVLSLMFDLCHEKPCVFRRDNGNLEPLIGAYARSCYINFKGCLDKGKNSIHKALESNGFKTFSAKDLVGIDPKLNKIDFKNEFFNVNFPDDYESMN